MRDASRALDDLPNRDAAQLVADAARARAPRRSGRLAGTIRATATGSGGTVSAGGGIQYAGVQEYGWPRWHIRPRYYLTGGADAAEPRVIDLYTDAAVDAADLVKGV